MQPVRTVPPSVGRDAAMQPRPQDSAKPQVRRRLVAICLAILAGCAPPVGEKRDEFGFNEVQRAALSRDFAALQALVQAGADLNASDPDRVTALHRAARDGDVEVAKFLLSYGARPDLVTSTGWTALHLAARACKPKVAELLLQYKADPLLPLPDGRTALHLACAKNDYPTVETLLADWVYKDRTTPENGVGKKDSHGDMPLHLALGQRDHRIAALLVAKGADVNAPNGDGIVPMVTACEAGSDYLAALLFTNGGDPNAVSPKGMTALQAAKNSGNVALVQLLCQWGAR